MENNRIICSSEKLYKKIVIVSLIGFSGDVIIKSIQCHLKSYIDRLRYLLQHKIVRYSLSFSILILVIIEYVLFEKYRNNEKITIFSIGFPTYLLVPTALVLALIATFYLSWNDPMFKKFKSPAVFLIILTGLFYVLIFSGIDKYLFELSLAKILTKLTAYIASWSLKILGLEIVSLSWNSENSTMLIFFGGTSSETVIGIDARCSGIHSLTVFLGVLIFMLIWSRKYLRWNYKILLITIFGLIGTYILNIIRVIIILIIAHHRGWEIAEPIHNYIGYGILALWVPIFWIIAQRWCAKAKETDKIESKHNEHVTRKNP